MRFLSVAIMAVLLTSLAACSNDQSSANTSDSKSSAKQAVSQTSHTILEPSGDIKNSVLAELKQGRWELVMFWATYCPICKRDFEKLAEFFTENPEVPITIVGVVVDGIEQKQKALRQISERHLDYTHVITDFDHSYEFYDEITESALVGVPSQLLYDTNNKLAGFSRNAIDIDALEIIVYE